MINTININYEHRFVTHKDKDFIGVSNENEVEKLRIELDEEKITESTTPYLEVEFPDGNKRSATMNRISNTTAELIVKNSLLKQEGFLKLELVLVDNSAIVFKSKTFKLEVLEAINAIETLEDDYPTILDEINKIKEDIKNLGAIDVSELNKKIEELEKKIQNITSYDDTEIKEEINRLKEEIDNIKISEGPPGENGKSAYEIAVENGFIGTVEEWLESLKGQDGLPGKDGEQGERGLQGLPGEKGEKGDPGADGKDGKDGYTPIKGTDYFTESEKTELINEVVTQVNKDVGLILDQINGEVV